MIAPGLVDSECSKSVHTMSVPTLHIMIPNGKNAYVHVLISSSVYHFISASAHQFSSSVNLFTSSPVHQLIKLFNAVMLPIVSMHSRMSISICMHVFNCLAAVVTALVLAAVVTALVLAKDVEPTVDGQHPWRHGRRRGVVPHVGMQTSSASTLAD